MVWVFLIIVGLVLGLLFRWWALLLAAGVGVWMFLNSTVDEVPAWFVPLASTLLISFGIALGVAARRAIRSTWHPSR